MAMLVLVVIEAVVLAFLALLVAGLLRSHAEILRALHDMGAGRDPLAARGATSPVAPPTLAPSAAGAVTAGNDVAGVTPTGDAVVVGVAAAPQPTLLAFLSSGCLTCREFWETFADPRLDVPGGARLVVVTMSPEDESVGALRRLVPASTPVVMSTPAWEAYEVEGSPYFVYVDGVSGAVVGEGTASSWDRVREMIDESVDDGALAASRRRAAARKTRAARRHLADREREARADDALLAAGIRPGDPRLYPATGGPADAEPDHD